MNRVAALEKRFWDKAIEGKKAQKLNYVEEFALSLLGALKGRRIMDCGAGAGTLSCALAKRGAKTVAFDLSFQSCRACKESAEAEGVKISVVNTSFESLPFKEGAMDGACGSFILHHVNVEEVAKSLKSVLKEGAKAVFIENSANNPFLLFLRRAITGKFGVPRYSSPSEYPMDKRRIEILHKYFLVNIHYPAFLFFRLLNVYLLKGKRSPFFRLFHWLDMRVEETASFLNKFGYLQVIELRKDGLQSRLSPFSG